MRRKLSESGIFIMTIIINSQKNISLLPKIVSYGCLDDGEDFEFLQFIKNELIERKNFNYPPFTKIIVITLKHADEALLNRASLDMAMHLKSALKERVLGPEFPIVKRVQNQYQKEIKIKYEKSLSDKKIKEHLLALLTNFYEMVSYKSIKVNIDVDAY
jgi:primosomal protein N' (replication factor Y)